MLLNSHDYGSTILFIYNSIISYLKMLILKNENEVFFFFLLVDSLFSVSLLLGVALCHTKVQSPNSSPTPNSRQLCVPAEL